MSNKEMYFMLDIETLGTEADSVICSIGACEFDIRTQYVYRKHYAKINWKKQIGKRSITADTLEYWFHPNKNNGSRDELIITPEHVGLTTALMGLREFITENQVLTDITIPMVLGSKYIWTKGNFDIKILENAYDQFGATHGAGYYPWLFRNLRDLRTLIGIAKIKDPTFDEKQYHGDKAHNALEDCITQCKQVIAAYSVLNS